MGYEVYIKRCKDWSDKNEKSTITLEEWINYAKQDRELKITNGYRLGNRDDTPFINDPGYCVWNAHPTRAENDKPYFAFEFGFIETKNPDELTLNKMLAIADYLCAKVQGEDGEIYPFSN
jgi:hypothetical protein